MTNLPIWIRQHTEGCESLMDLGSGMFGQLQFSGAAKNIGVEIFQKYIEVFDHRGVIPVCEDMRNLESVFNKVGMERVSCIMLIDSLEHVPKPDGVDLLKKCQERSDRVLVFTPLGFHEQIEDAWGYGNPHQKHESGWLPEELIELGFNTTTEEEFHGPKGGAIFAVWDRSGGNE